MCLFTERSQRFKVTIVLLLLTRKFCKYALPAQLKLQRSLLFPLFPYRLIQTVSHNFYSLNTQKSKTVQPKECRATTSIVGSFFC